MATAARVRRRTRRTRSLIAVLAVVLAGAGLWWGRSWLAGGSVSRGVAAYKRGDWGAAYRLAEERLEAAKDDPSALRLLARASSRLGRFAESRSIYNRLGVHDLEAEDHCVLGLGWNLSGEPIEAQKALHQALSADPDHAESLYLLGLSAYQMGQGWNAPGPRAAGVALGLGSKGGFRAGDDSRIRPRPGRGCHGDSARPGARPRDPGRSLRPFQVRRSC
jgi:tetratricopeptide (TPR) repeat protein